MNEKPILFSTPMVQALLDGRKTMTRIIIKQKPGVCMFCGCTDPDCRVCIRLTAEACHWINEEKTLCSACSHLKWTHKAKYQIGDLLWVKETFCLTQPFDPETYYFGYKCGIKPYSNNEASNKYNYSTPDKWKPSLFMPREAARIWLKVTDVRIERLNDISEEDAIKEGIESHVVKNERNYLIYSPKEKTKGIFCGPCKVDGTYVSKTSAFFSDKPAFHSFISLWEHINGSGSSKFNPWVFVYTFKVIYTNGNPSDDLPF